MIQTKAYRPHHTYTDEFKNQLLKLYLNGKRKCAINREYKLLSSLLDKQSSILPETWVYPTDRQQRN